MGADKYVADPGDQLSVKPGLCADDTSDRVPEW